MKEIDKQKDELTDDLCSELDSKSLVSKENL